MTRVGDVLASKYRLEELLGSGGMGHVYRATNEDVGRAVAIKVLRSEHATNASIVERFLREARAANLVRHPNVVDVLDIGRDGDGSPFIVQELLQGQDLSKYVEARGGKLDLGEIESYFLPVVDAVAEAHARGVVHRDIKPDNVFLANEGKRRVPKLLDFGISKIRLPDIRTTEVGVMMGTPAYMAPEQIQGSRDADARTDVWALGIMLFELLAGRLPFDIGDAPALFVAVATRDMPALLEVCPDVAPEISRVVGRCLRRTADERYPSALELARDLRHVLAGTEIEPTQRFSLPPPRANTGPSLEIPDLALPQQRRAPQIAPAPKTIAGPPGALALNRTELSVPRKRGSVPDLELGSNISARAPSPTPSQPQQQQAAFQPPPASTPERQPPSAGLQTRSQTSGGLAPLDGMMIGPGAPSSAARRPPYAGRNPAPERPVEPMQDMSALIGLAVVGLTAIGATAVLMTFAHQPEGLHVVQYVTKPTPTSTLVAHGALALVGFVLAGRFTKGGLSIWRGDAAGGRGAALFHSIIGGAFFFAAIELARAAW